MKNIELKLKIDNFGTLIPLLNSRSNYKGPLIQNDIYYLTTNPRLKIREELDKTELIYYKRADSVKSKDSRYFIININYRLRNIAKSLLNTFLRVKRTVKKHRELYIYKNTRIHLDSVEGIGKFLELETVVREAKNYHLYQKEHDEVIQLFNLDVYKKIAVSYSDLILN